MKFDEKLIAKLHPYWQYFIRLAQKYEQRKDKYVPIDEHIVLGYQMYNIASNTIPH